ncbi:MAG: ABC transporter substrate-binding protein [Bacteroidetes bacterium]|nr:ABC transporter substrate-binding protein [Bacteroidota bacterium]
MVLHYKKIIAVAILFFLLLLSLFSCGSKKNNNSDKKIFHYNELGGISSLDPAATRNTENIWAVNQLFNGLLQMDDKLNIKPCIAKQWAISEDGKTYTFFLRSDVYFHPHKQFKNEKGRKVLASDFVYSFKRLFNPKVSSALSLLDNINTDFKEGIEAINDTTLNIYLKENFSPFLGILTMKYFSVVPKEVVEYYGEDFRKNPIGTGPFCFKAWEEGTQLTMTRNENYFEKDEQGKALPYLDAVTISFMKDKETSFMQFIKGDLDMVSGMEAFNPGEVLDDDGKLKPFYKEKFVLQTHPCLKTEYLGFLIDDKEESVKNNPVTNRNVRRAINYAIDREKIIKFFHRNIGIPAQAGFIPPALPSYNPNKVQGFTYNPDKARELLLEAGFPNGKKLPEIELYCTENYTEMFEFIQSELAESGIKIKIVVEKPSVLTPAIANNEIPFFRKSWIGDYPDEENFMSLFYSKNFSPKGFNYTHYSNPIFDKDYEQARNCLNDSLKIAFYQKMDQMLLDDAPVVPLYYDEVVRLVSPKIQGLTANPMNLLNLKQVQKTN